MKRHLIASVFCPFFLFVLVVLTGSSESAFGAAYIKFDGVDGEVQESSHKDWILIESISQHIRKPGAGSANPGETQLSDFVVVKQLDKSTPKLQEACASGTFIGDATIDWIAPLAGSSESKMVRYELKNVLISSYQLGAAEIPSMTGTGGGSGPDIVPTDQFTLNFEEIKIEYRRVDAAGGVISEGQGTILNPARTSKD